MISKIAINFVLVGTTISFPVAFGTYFHLSGNNKTNNLDKSESFLKDSHQNIPNNVHNASSVDVENGGGIY